MLSKIYRIPFSPTGCGKNQLCNFIYQDKENTKFKVSDGFDSVIKILNLRFSLEKLMMN